MKKHFSHKLLTFLLLATFLTISIETVLNARRGSGRSGGRSSKSRGYYSAGYEHKTDKLDKQLDTARSTPVQPASATPAIPEGQLSLPETPLISEQIQKEPTENVYIKEVAETITNLKPINPTEIGENANIKMKMYAIKICLDDLSSAITQEKIATYLEKNIDAKKFLSSKIKKLMAQKKELELLEKTEEPCEQIKSTNKSLQFMQDQLDTIETDEKTYTIEEKPLLKIIAKHVKKEISAKTKRLRQLKKQLAILEKSGQNDIDPNIENQDENKGHLEPLKIEMNQKENKILQKELCEDIHFLKAMVIK